MDPNNIDTVRQVGHVIIQLFKNRIDLHLDLSLAYANAPSPVIRAKSRS
jgi:hypothetical protein